jgi:hypothetical protein
MMPDMELLGYVDERDEDEDAMGNFFIENEDLEGDEEDDDDPEL